MMDLALADPFVVIVSRVDVASGNVTSTIEVLERLFESADTVRAFRNRVDIWFHGYDGDRRELFEILKVRDFVYKLDEQFPYWLYFLTKHGTGLQALAFCFFSQDLTEEARQRIWPQRLGQLIEKRWGPALLEVGYKAGHTEAEVDEMLMDALHYFTEGPRLPFDAESA